MSGSPLPRIGIFEIQRSIKKIAIRRVTLGNACSIRVNERNPFLPGKLKRDRGYAAREEISNTPIVKPIARRKVFNVSIHILGSANNNPQLESVNPPNLPSGVTGSNPYVLREKVEIKIHRKPRTIGRDRIIIRI